MVDHVILLSKLEAYKLDRNVRNALLWFKSYLTDRIQRVSFKGKTSIVRTITAAVPRGSILGLLLFVLFVSALPLNVHTRIDMFTDDTTLLTSSDYLNVEELKSTVSLGSITSRFSGKEPALLPRHERAGEIEPISHARSPTSMSGQQTTNCHLIVPRRRQY